MVQTTARAARKTCRCICKIGELRLPFFETSYLSSRESGRVWASASFSGSGTAETLIFAYGFRYNIITARRFTPNR